MKRGLIFGLAGVLALSIFANSAHASVVDFETVPVGTSYGQAFGDLPGDVVLVQDDIRMSVEEFSFGSFQGFIKAEIGGLYAQSFPTQALDLDNINARFDFADLGFNVTQVTLSYMEFGGTDNFRVNGQTLFELGAMTDLPSDVAPGVVASVDSGVITLNGLITSLTIGGQEFAIDNIAAVPEPTTLAFFGVGGALLALRRRRSSV